MLLVHYINDVILLLTSMMQISTNYKINAPSCLKTCEWYLCSTTIEKIRHSEIPCSISVFDTGASKM